MIEETIDTHSHRILITPNRSATWRFNKYLILSLLVLSGGIATVFAMLGAWMILPFAGLELASLAGCLYYVCWKLSYLQVIDISKDSVTIEKGYYYPRQQWQVDPCDVLVSVAPRRHHLDPQSISVKADGEVITLGDFLNKEETELLADKLKSAGLVTVKRLKRDS